MKKNKLQIALLGAIIFISSCRREIPAKNEKDGAISKAVIMNLSSIFSGSHDLYPVQSEETSLLAGNVYAGFQDGTGKDAQFNAPSDIATDADGYIYIADAVNNRIRKITPDGVVSTFAGTGQAGFGDGTASAALFNNPTGIAFGPDGSMYIADMGNNRIRKITPDGTMVSTVAGTGAAGFSDGPGTVARFKGPAGVAVDPAGVVYVTDRGNNRIRRISVTGIVTQWVGDGVAGFKDGTGTYAELNSPWGIAVGAGGVIYVADLGNNRIRKIASGVISTIGGDNTFHTPTDVATDAKGNIFIADMGNNVIRRMTPAGVVTTICGSGFSGYYDSYDTHAQLEPWGLTVDIHGYMYVAERNSEVIRKITPVKATHTLAGNGVTGYREGKGALAQFRQPFGIVVDNAGNAYVSDYQDNRIRKITPDGTTSLFAGSGAWAHVDGIGAAASFQGPSGLAIDPSGNIYVYDYYTVRKITPAGVVSTIGVASEYGNLALDPAGNVYATDANNQYIIKITTTGLSQTQFAKVPPLEYVVNGVTVRDPGYSRNITAISNGFAIGDGILNGKYLMDYNGNFSTPLPPNAYDDRGIPLNLSLLAQTADSYNNMYYATSRNNIVRLAYYSPYTYVYAGGQEYTIGYADGPNYLVRFNRPMGLTFGPEGVMYVADSANHAVRILTK